mgnify:CR=1 FL=1
MPWREVEGRPHTKEADLPPGRELIARTVPAVAEAIRAFIDTTSKGSAARHVAAAGMLNRLQPEQAAMLAMRVMMNAVIDDAGLTQTAMQIGDLLIDHIEMADFRRSDQAAFKTMARKRRRSAFSTVKRTMIRAGAFADRGITIDATMTERVRVGTKLIEIVCDVTGLFEMFQERKRKRLRWIVRPRPEVLAFLVEHHGRCELLRPILMPMLVPPRRWRGVRGGGYLTLRGNHLIRNRSRAQLDEAAGHDLTSVLTAVNAVQGVAWRINRRVHDVLREVWDNGGSLANLPRRADMPMPVRPADADEAAHLLWKARAAQVYADNRRLSARRIGLSQKLWVADRLKAETAIYFPHSCDWRGRVYPIANGGPHPHGDDIGRGLLEFSEAKPITDDGAQWLGVHLANLFGIDKVSFDERREWVKANLALILDSADHPLDGQRFWSEADNPWQALAACCEYAGYIREGAGFMSRLAVALDGSSSGLQHYTALLRDETAAQAVNLIPGDKPGDLYTVVQDRVVARALASDDPLAAFWRTGLIRKIVKKPTMTYVYSATRYGFQDQVMADTNEGSESPRERSGSAYWLSLALWEEIGLAVPAATRVMVWLKTVARLFVEAGQPIRWKSPIGLPISQDYRSKKLSRVRCFLNGRTMELSLRRDVDQLDTRSMVNGISPNFVHALDASHLMSVVCRLAKRGCDLTVVHDTFGCRAADVPAMTDVLRDAFIEQYRNDVLADFREQLVGQLPPDLAARMPPLPDPGTLNLEALRGSQYLFH